MTGNKHRDTVRPWHERTPLVIGASIGALIVIGLLYWAISAVARHYNQPPPAPTQYVGPPNTTIATVRTTATATQATPTSTVPIQTSEIDNPSTDTSGETSGTDTSPSSPSTSTSSTSSTPTSVTQSRHNHATDGRAYPSAPGRHANRQ